METKREVPQPPHILSSPAPEEEHTAIFRLNTTLGELRRYVMKLWAAIGLFEFAEKEKGKHPMIGDWRNIAARDGAMTLYHFSCVFARLRQSMKDTLSVEYDVKALRNADREFLSKFPRVRGIRNSISHAGEHVETQAKFDKHAYTGSLDRGGLRIRNEGGAKLIISDTLDANRFTETYKNEVVSYEVSYDSLEKLVDVLEIIYSAFNTGPHDS
ncbi:MAG: hypothetical protein ACTSX7_03780 [Alphaproteobacteria bacterium]